MSLVRIAGTRALLTLFVLSGTATCSFAQLAPVTPLQTTTPLRSTTLGARTQTTTAPTPNTDGSMTTTTQTFAAPQTYGQPTYVQQTFVQQTFAQPPAAMAGSPAYWGNQWNWNDNTSTSYVRTGRLGYARAQPNYGCAPNYGGYAPGYGYRGNDYAGASVFYTAVLPGNGAVTTGRLFGYGLPNPMPPAATAFPPHSGMFPMSTATTPAGTAVPYGW